MNLCRYRLLPFHVSGALDNILELLFSEIPVEHGELEEKLKRIGLTMEVNRESGKAVNEIGVTNWRLDASPLSIIPGFSRPFHVPSHK